MIDKIKRVYIEITNVCNLSCNFCPKTKREYRFMGREEFDHIIEQVKPYTDYIYLHIMGEPLLNPEIEYFLEQSERHGLKVNLTTNGTMLKKVGDRLLQAKALRQVNFSLHSYEANISEVDLRNYIGSVLRFVKKANETTEMICAMRLWNMDSEELKGANNMNREILEMIEKEFELTEPIADQLDGPRGIKLRDRVYLNMAEKFAWPDIKRATLGDEVFCHGLRNQLGILVDGTVVPCCLDSEGNINLGNIHESSLTEILEGKRAKDIYEGFSRRHAVEELCQKCGYAKRF